MNIKVFLSAISMFFVVSSCSVTKIETTKYIPQEDTINNVLVIYNCPEGISDFVSGMSFQLSEMFASKGIKSNFLIMPDHKSGLSLMSPKEIEKEKIELIYKKKLTQKVDYLFYINTKSELAYSSLDSKIYYWEFEAKLFDQDSDESFFDADFSVSVGNLGIDSNTANGVRRKLEKTLVENGIM